MFVKYCTINLKCIVTIFGKADLDCSLQKPLTILHNARRRSFSFRKVVATTVDFKDAKIHRDNIQGTKKVEYRLILISLAAFIKIQISIKIYRFYSVVRNCNKIITNNQAAVEALSLIK